MTRTVEIAGTFVRVEVIVWRPRSVLARRVDNGAAGSGQVDTRRIH